MKAEKRGLAWASEDTKKRVATIGGSSYHQVRGLQLVSTVRRREIARTGGTTKAARIRNGPKTHDITLQCIEIQAQLKGWVEKYKRQDKDSEILQGYLKEALEQKDITCDEAIHLIRYPRDKSVWSDIHCYVDIARLEEEEELHDLAIAKAAEADQVIQAALDACVLSPKEITQGHLRPGQRQLLQQLNDFQKRNRVLEEQLLKIKRSMTPSQQIKTVSVPKFQSLSKLCNLFNPRMKTPSIDGRFTLVLSNLRNLFLMLFNRAHAALERRGFHTAIKKQSVSHLQKEDA